MASQTMKKVRATANKDAMLRPLLKGKSAIVTGSTSGIGLGIRSRRRRAHLESLRPAEKRRIGRLVGKWRILYFLSTAHVPPRPIAVWQGCQDVCVRIRWF